MEPVITGWVADWLPDETSFTFQQLIPLFDYCQDKESTEIHQIISWVDDNWCGVLKPVELGHLGSLLLDSTDEAMDEIASSQSPMSCLIDIHCNPRPHSGARLPYVYQIFT
ncbi:MAG: hypothetical protein KZQ81_08210, partial [Candidatus Thiodiazotropha sp. (ex Rostrolucina anterorostrata)]|nr:hypothetical protein [Candidatus Thiodiazotropha sp. (ex Rostrolucina anterorostrata)]